MTFFFTNLNKSTAAIGVCVLTKLHNLWKIYPKWPMWLKGVKFDLNSDIVILKFK